MSQCGNGEVSADFPGIARARRQRDDPKVHRIYFTGCAGDSTAGKYNTGSPTNRTVLADRLYQGMLAAWQNTKRQPLRRVDYRVAKLNLPVGDTGDFTVAAMPSTLANTNATRWKRISAALGLSWRQRVAAGRPIDIPGVDFNRGEAFGAGWAGRSLRSSDNALRAP